MVYQGLFIAPSIYDMIYHGLVITPSIYDMVYHGLVITPSICDMVYQELVLTPSKWKSQDGGFQTRTILYTVRNTDLKAVILDLSLLVTLL